MTATKTYDFSTDGDYTYDSDNIQIVSDTVKMVLQDYPSQTFSEDYADDTDFDYDSDKAEWSIVAPLVAYADYETDGSFDFNASLGSLTGAPGGGANTAVVADGKLKMINDDYSYVSYDMTGTGIASKGAIEFVYIPNYSGSPRESQIMFEGLDSAGKSRAYLQNTSSGNLRWWFTDTDGFTIISDDVAAWSPTADTSYNISINWDFVTGSGALRLFVDGVQLGSTITGLYSRNEITDITIGNRAATPGTVSDANYSLEYIVFYNEVQRTENYTPSTFTPPLRLQQKLQTLGDFDYAETYIQAPLQTASGSTDGTLVSFQSWVDTGSSNIKYTVNTAAGVPYWYNSVSSAWEISNETYAQSNTAAEIVANYSNSIPSITTTFKYGLIFPGSNVQEYTTNLAVEYTHQLYPTDDPVISVVSASRVYAEELATYVESLTLGTNTAVKYIMVLDGTKTYWSGSAWVSSNGAYAQSNTAAEITANIATLITSNTQFGIDFILHSDDGLFTPTLDSITLTYDEGKSPPSTLPRLVDINGHIYSGVSAYDALVILFRPYQHGFNNPNTGVDGGVFHAYKWNTLSTTASDGFFSGSLYVQPAGEYWEVKIEKQKYKFQLPDQDAVDFNSLTLSQVD